MSRLSIETPGRAQNVLDGLHRDMERRIGASAYGLCPVDMLSLIHISEPTRP